MAAISSNPLSSTPCLNCQVEVDHYLFTPTLHAIKMVVKLVPTLPMTKFTDTIIPRILLVAQSIISLVALPFKMLFAIFSGIDAIINSEDPKAWLNLGYAMASVGIHALTVPAGIILACLPLNSIKNGITSMTSVGPEAFRNLFEERAGSILSNMGMDI